MSFILFFFPSTTSYCHWVYMDHGYLRDALVIHAWVPSNIHVQHYVLSPPKARLLQLYINCLYNPFLLLIVTTLVYNSLIPLLSFLSSMFFLLSSFVSVLFFLSFILISASLFHKKPCFFFFHILLFFSLFRETCA